MMECGSSNDGGCEDVQMKPKLAEVPTEPTICVRCNNDRAILRMPIDPVCRGCFTEYVARKFKTNIRKRTRIERNDKVLVAFSGGQSSRCLLELIARAISPHARKKMFFDVGVIHVDQSCILSEEKCTELCELRERLKNREDNLAKQWKTTNFSVCSDLQAEINRLRTEIYQGEHQGDLTFLEITKIMNSYKYVCSHTIRIEELLIETGEVGDLDDARELLNRRFRELSDPTAKNTMLSELRNQLLSIFAKKFGYKKILLGECSDRVAVRALSMTSRGCGTAVPQSVAYIEEKFEIPFLRPLRDFLSRFLAHFVHCEQLETVFQPTFDTKLTKKTGVDKLTEKFVMDLQGKFPNTVPNILRTCARLKIFRSLENNCGQNEINGSCS